MGLSGGLAVFWRNSYEVEVMSASNRVIDTKVKQGNSVFYLTFVYGDPVRHKRRLVWNALQDIGLNRNDGLRIVGDFKEVMNNYEKLRGPYREEGSFIPFRSMVRTCIIKEIPSSGNKFPWAGVREVTSNGVKENVWIQCRLDKAFGNA